MSEFHAAVGLLQLGHFEEVRRLRAEVDRRYRDGLADVAGIDPLPLPADTVPNHSYFPVLARPTYPLNRDALREVLGRRGIQTRR